MADLRVQFSEIYGKVASFLGWVSPPTLTDLTNAKDIVYRGYRRFLYPVNAQTGKAHTWNFLYKNAQLVTEADKWIYRLPEDFGELTVDFIFDEDASYSPPKKIDSDGILDLRSMSDTSGNPLQFALRRTNFTKETGQGWEVLFYPTPDGVYNLFYSYLANPLKPDNAADYFVGGPEVVEAIIENCLAVAEQEYDEQLGIHSQLADKLIQELIQRDLKTTVSRTVGKNLDPSVQQKIGVIRFNVDRTDDEIYC